MASVATKRFRARSVGLWNRTSNPQRGFSEISAESLTVATDDQASCGLGKTFFKEGHYYLVYAYGEPRSSQLGTGLFSGTKEIVHAFGIWHAPPDLMVLGPGSPVR